jgi:nucleotide-binding universal stress UspA family protein
MTTFQHILVPVDFGDASNEALEMALGLAPKLDAKITILHATWLPPYYYSTYAEGLAWPTEELEGQAKKALDEVVEKTRARYAKVEGKLVAGEPRDLILQAARELRTDMIVMGTHGRRGIKRALLGSVAERIVRTSPVPVLTVSARDDDAAVEQPTDGTAAVRK